MHVQGGEPPSGPRGDPLATCAANAWPFTDPSVSKGVTGKKENTINDAFFLQRMRRMMIYRMPSRRRVAANCGYA
ncbi:hypothetical protein GCM10020219_073440 [Nonomuraea dietziae]